MDHSLSILIICFVSAFSVGKRAMILLKEYVYLVSCTIVIQRDNVAVKISV